MTEQDTEDAINNLHKGMVVQLAEIFAVSNLTVAIADKIQLRINGLDPMAFMEKARRGFRSQILRSIEDKDPRFAAYMQQQIDEAAERNAGRTVEGDAEPAPPAV